MSSDNVRFEDRGWTEPYIQVLPNGIPQPVFVFALCPGLHQLKVPQAVTAMSFDKEIKTVCRMFRKHRARFPRGSWLAGRGFVYHRGMEETLVFDRDCRLQEISSDSKPRVAGYFRL